MAIIAPFRGLTYSFTDMNRFPALVAPPYDVISEEEQDRLYKADPYNVIRLILGKKRTGDSDWDNRYTRAADDFKRWESEGMLTLAEKPCIYLTSMTYDPKNGEGERTRWGIIALVRIEDEDSGTILPHERTFSAHKDDRLKLMRACNAQFSQIFGLYEDPTDSVLSMCRDCSDVTPRIDFDLEDGTNHKMWALNDNALIGNISREMSDKAIFIADGHHRYETARNFRNIMRARYGAGKPGRPYEYVMMYLTCMSGEGLTILPSHRLIKSVPDFNPEFFLKKVENWFEISKHPLSGDNISVKCSRIKKLLQESGRLDSTFVFYLKQSDHFRTLRLKQGARDKMNEGLHRSLKNLDVIILSRLVFKDCLGFTKEDLDNESIFHYESNIEAAVSQVQSGRYEMTFLLNPTKIEHVKEIATNGLVMPRKSTYFYPKVITGLVLNKINPHELIQIP